MSQNLDMKSNGKVGELKGNSLKPPLPMAKLSPRTSTVRQGLVKDKPPSGTKYRKQQTVPSRIEAPSAGGKSSALPGSKRQTRSPKDQCGSVGKQVTVTEEAAVKTANKVASPRVSKGMSENASSKRPVEQGFPRATKGLTKNGAIVKREPSVSSPRTSKFNEEATSKRKPRVTSPVSPKARSDEATTRRQSGMPSPRASKALGISRPNLQNAGVKSPKMPSGNSKVVRSNRILPKNVPNDKSTLENVITIKERHADEENNNLEPCLPDFYAREQDEPHEDTEKVGNHIFFLLGLNNKIFGCP